MRYIRDITLTDHEETTEISNFLQSFQLAYHPEELDATSAVYEDGVLVATGSFSGETIRNIAITQDYQGEGLSFTLISHIIDQMSRRGIFHYFIFTKPEAALMFESSGFQRIAEAKGLAVLLEFGADSISQYCARLRGLCGSVSDREAAALVMNCNPFTKGHQYLIETAARQAAIVYLFVVEEDRSEFSFTDRFAMVQKGTAHLANVKVLPTGRYAISSATFPSYFTKGKDTLSAQIALDLDLFGRRIAPALNIKTRFVGQEPISEVTREYNKQMRSLLPVRYGIDVVEIERLESSGVPISASRVREAIRANDWICVKKLVPQTTFDYLSGALPHETLQGDTEHS